MPSDTAAGHARGTCLVQLGDLHADMADGWAGIAVLRAAVAELGIGFADRADGVLLPGDNANHGTAEQYAAIRAGLAPLTLPWRVIPGDHDFEPGDLSAYLDAFAPAERPGCETIGGCRVICLDIVSAGGGGPDFRLRRHDLQRLARELASARAEALPAVVVMHAYPGDLAADGATLARLLAEGDAAYVATGHTHYNELLNDGRVVYGATRSSAQIEEDAGRPGYSITCLHDGALSWRFRRLGAPWPHVQIVSPGDLRLITRPWRTAQVPRPGPVAVRVRLFGPADTAPVLHWHDPCDRRHDGPAPREISPGLWTATLDLDQAGRHRIEAGSGPSRDAVDILVRPADELPRRGLETAPGQACHAIGAWPEAGIDGAQLGPNRNGRAW